MAGRSVRGSAVVVALVACVVAPGAGAAEPAPAADSGQAGSEERSDYRAGRDLGERLATMERAGEPVDLDVVLRGIRDGMEGGAGSAPVSRGRHRGFKDDYAALNAQRPGVVTLDSGVQYEVLESGSGQRPEAGGAVLVRYVGTLADGKVFDTTGDGPPLELPLDTIAAPGLREALLLMREGDHWRVVIPPSMGFRRSGNNQLRRRDLIYDLELVEVVKP